MVNKLIDDPFDPYYEEILQKVKFVDNSFDTEQFIDAMLDKYNLSDTQLVRVFVRKHIKERLRDKTRELGKSAFRGFFDDVIIEINLDRLVGNNAGRFIKLRYATLDWLFDEFKRSVDNLDKVSKAHEKKAKQYELFQAWDIQAEMNGIPQEQRIFEMFILTVMPAPLKIIAPHTGRPIFTKPAD